jgi:hypothetical protein
MSSKGGSDNEGEIEEEKKIEYKYYLTQESAIQANNDRTMKLRQEKREREMKLKMEQDEQRRLREVLDNKQRDEERMQKERAKALAEKRKLQEGKKEEEVLELKDLKGNFAKTVLDIRANNTALEMVMTGTEYTTV